MFQQSPPDSVGIVRVSAIGDTCHALAVARAIQDTWPETRVTWIIGSTEATLLADIAGIEFIIFDKRAGLGAYADVRQRVAGRRFDALLCLHASMRVNPLYALLRSPLKIGYDRERARDGQWLFTNREVPSTHGRHVQDVMLSFAHAIGVPQRAPRWDIPLSDAQREFAADVRVEGRPLMVLSPCSSDRARNFRNWPAENYAATVRHAYKKHGCLTVVTGGGSDLEHDYANRIRALAGDSVVDLVGRTSLKELLALIAVADLVLCPDSGPAHMATTVGTPVVGLYATSNPARTGPYGSLQHVVNAYPEAAERFLGRAATELRWGERVRDPGAMGLIRLAQVTQKIDEILRF